MKWKIGIISYVHLQYVVKQFDWNSFTCNETDWSIDNRKNYQPCNIGIMNRYTCVEGQNETQVGLGNKGDWESN